MKEFTLNYCSNEASLEVTSTGQILGTNSQIQSTYNNLYSKHLQLCKQLNKVENSMGLPVTQIIPKQNILQLNLNQICIILNKLYGSNRHITNKLNNIKNILNQTTKINNLTNCYI